MINEFKVYSIVSWFRFQLLIKDRDVSNALFLVFVRRWGLNGHAYLGCSHWCISILIAIPTTKYCFFLGSLAYDWLLRIFFLLYLYLLEREK